MLLQVYQCGPSTGPQAACDPQQRFQWPGGSIQEKSSNLKFVEKRVEKRYICLAELLALDKVHLHKNNTVSV